jgi:AraC-like DNA-binding protein
MSIRLRSRQSHDMRETASSAGSRNEETYLELAGLIARHTVSGRTSTAIEGLQLGRSSAQGSPVYLSQWPCLAMVAQGRKTATIAGKTYQYGVGDYLLVSLDMPVASCVTEATEASPYLGLGITINPVRLKEVLSRYQATCRPDADNKIRSAGVNRATTELLCAIMKYIRLLDRPEDIPVLAPLAEQEVLYRLLQGPMGPSLIQLALIETSGNRVARVIAWIKDNYAKTFRVEDAAAYAGMSVSALHHNFKTVTELTPLQYVKQLRLQEARRMIIFERCDVANAGFQVGYQSASQFSRDYSRHFGHAPSQEFTRRIAER